MPWAYTVTPPWQAVRAPPSNSYIGGVFDEEEDEEATLGTTLNPPLLPC